MITKIMHGLTPIEPARNVMPPLIREDEVQTAQSGRLTVPDNATQAILPGSEPSTRILGRTLYSDQQRTSFPAVVGRDAQLAVLQRSQVLDRSRAGDSET